MVRPSEFDRENAIRAAMRSIWQHGYDSMSVKALSEELGITRSSFYNAFKSREDLFWQALDVYAEQLPDLPDPAVADGQLLAGLTRYFRSLCQFHAKNRWRGCMIANAIAELCAPGHELSREMTRRVGLSVGRFTDIVDAAKRFGEIDESRDSRELALTLQNLSMGLSSLAKAIRDESEIWAMTRATLTGLDLYAAG